MDAKLIAALTGVRNSLTDLIKELDVSTGVKTTKSEVASAEPEAKEEKVPVKKTPTAKSRKEREASEKLPEIGEELTQEQLDSLSYNNLKKVAKNMGISATGSRDELTQKILDFDPSDAEDSDDEEEAPAPTKKSKKSPVATKKSKKTAPVEEDDDDDEDDDEEEDPIVSEVNNAVQDMSDEEIMDALTEAGVKAKGKRQALISAVIKAVRDGKIVLSEDDDDDDDSEEDEEEEVKPAPSKSKKSKKKPEPEPEPEDEDDSDDDEEYDVNDPDNPDMTEERKTALEAFDSDTREGFKNGEITRKEIIAWLNEYNQTKDSMKKVSDEDLLDTYIYCSSLLINDEGEMPEEEGAYTVNGIPYCCGHELTYNEDNETYICEHCGVEYNAEDDEDEE